MANLPSTTRGFLCLIPCLIQIILRIIYCSGSIKNQMQREEFSILKKLRIKSTIIRHSMSRPVKRRTNKCAWCLVIFIYFWNFFLIRFPFEGSSQRQYLKYIFGLTVVCCVYIFCLHFCTDKFPRISFTLDIFCSFRFESSRRRKRTRLKEFFVFSSHASVLLLYKQTAVVFKKGNSMMMKLLLWTSKAVT